MPEVYVYAVEGQTLEQKRSLVKDITEAVSRNFQVAPEKKGGVLFSDRT